jgi:UDP-N-acetylglucosamine 3-dehydrogenase
MTKKLGFGVISASNMGIAHMQTIKTYNNAELLAICDLDIERLNKAAKEFKGVATYTDYKEMLHRDDIDAVIVATPDQVHAEHTINSLEAGKHVLCEKPMALTLEDCKAMVDSAEKTGKKLMIGQICRYAPGFMITKELIEKGEIGELFFVESEYAHDYSKIPGVGGWRIDPVKLRHPIIGGGCHAVDLLRWIAGDPYEVTAYANKKVLRDWPVDDCTIAIMRFPNDVIGKVFTSIGCKRAYTMRSVFYGDKGTIIADNHSPFITIYKEQYKRGEHLFANGTDQRLAVRYPVAINSHNIVAELSEFIDTINQDLPVLTDGRQGAATVAVCLAAVESAAKGERVKVRYI